MSVIKGYLTPRLFDIWDLSRTGLRQTEIADKLGISRQTVNRALQEATEKVTRALTETATINKVAIESIDSTNGLLMGWSQEFSVKTVISITKKDGMQVWYEHVADCNHCKSYFACQGYLLRSAKERGLRLAKEQRKLIPSELAQVVFGMNKK
ncbi:MAG TPA: helix-turn-helix domain-containing protein [Candidatus Acidoferrum sp.]|nr:helix-turn-helix domain-containing protein [Candidatus Acidoferrum sp.]